MGFRVQGLGFRDGGGFGVWVWGSGARLHQGLVLRGRACSQQSGIFPGAVCLKVRVFKVACVVFVLGLKPQPRTLNLPRLMSLPGCSYLG